MAQKKQRTGTRRQKKGSFLSRFELDEAYLLRPNEASGRPGIIRGVAHTTNRPVLIKVWPRKAKTDDAELAEIWRHEIRQLHRLAGFPGAGDLIVPLIEADLDDEGFYLVLDAANHLEPVSVWRSHHRTAAWLRLPRQPSDRRRMWLNLRRVALALELLHRQGLLHRNLDEFSVHTACQDEPDFQLSGFEWSLRMVSAPPTRSKRATSSEESTFSFQTDWMAYAFLAADLFGINRERLLRRSLPASDVNESLKSEEVRLLRQIIGLEPVETLDGDVVVDRIDSILSSLQAEISGEDLKYILIAQANAGFSLVEKIKSIDGLVETEEEAIEWMTADLSGEPKFIAMKSKSNGGDANYAIIGNNLVYKVKPYRPTRDAPESWSFAYCNDAEKLLPNLYSLGGVIPIPNGSIELITAKGAAKRTARLHGKSASWEGLRSAIQPSQPELTKAEQVYRALGLVQLLETLVAAAESYPVLLIKPSRIYASVDGSSEAWVVPRSDVSLEELSANLDLRQPAVRLSKLLSDERAYEEEWVLSELLAGERDQLATEWRFERTETLDGVGKVYVFKGSEPPPPNEYLFLRSKQFDGQAELIRRRLKSLQALRDHRELLAMISDLRRRVVNSHEDMAEDEKFRELDVPKQGALKAAWSVLPSYLVQGPPGVGKTRLVREIVRRRLHDDKTSRMLLTAQSHHAVAHLMKEVVEEFKPTEGLEQHDFPLIVRVVPRDQRKEVEPSEYDLDRQTRSLLEGVKKSRLAENAPPKLRARLGLLDPYDQSTSYNRERLYVESAVLRSANVVFSTTNAQALERLIDERGQVDWSIIEEAGKATGPELLAPLLLSHRRLLIGDHKQLPPFNSDFLVALLGKPEKVEKALRLATDVIGRSMRDDATIELVDSVVENPGNIPALCSESISMLLLFEHWIETEFRRQEERIKQAKPPSSLQIAGRLTTQHRMHPVISDLVSECFYSGALKTDSARCEKFHLEEKAGRRPLYFLAASEIPESPIVLIDTKYISRGGNDGEAANARYNKSEQKAVIAVLKALRANPHAAERPTIAVLSPYRQQVSGLDRLIMDLRSTELSHLDDFAGGPGNRIHCGTVDSFQGDEADVVILSLVRNNHHAGARALGFLSDPRRMNVLLSRAKWRLILVGSLEFLSEVVEAPTNPNDVSNVDLGFLRKMIARLRARPSGISVVPWSELKRRAL